MLECLSRLQLMLCFQGFIRLYNWQTGSKKIRIKYKPWKGFQLLVLTSRFLILTIVVAVALCRPLVRSSVPFYPHPSSPLTSSSCHIATSSCHPPATSCHPAASSRTRAQSSSCKFYKQIAPEAWTYDVQSPKTSELYAIQCTVSGVLTHIDRKCLPVKPVYQYHIEEGHNKCR